MRLNRPVEITRDRLLLCEGAHDAAFFRELINHHSLPPFNVFVTSDLTEAQGADGFGATLFALRSVVGFSKLKELVLVRDSDDDYAASFASVVNQIKNVAATTPPDRPHTFAVPLVAHTKATGNPNVTILMLPWHDRNGALETLCYEAASRSHNNIRHCVDNFEACISCGNWQEQKKDKMRLRCFIAGITIRSQILVWALYGEMHLDWFLLMTNHSTPLCNSFPTFSRDTLRARMQ